MSWDPRQYHLYGGERLRPALELLARVDLDAPGRIFDLGCGAGEMTATMANRWPKARVTGLDASSEMLKEASRRHPQVTFMEGDIAAFAPEEAPDLIFSNAALHWLPDHGRLFSRLMDSLRAGGVLAVQMPRNFDAPSHVLLRETAADSRWRDRMERLLDWRPVAAPDTYYRILKPTAVEIDVWETEYLHALEGRDAVLEWVRGSALRAYLARLKEAERTDFEARYADGLRRAYPEKDGEVLFPFRRLFIVARRQW